MAPLASSLEIFQVQDKRFSLTGEDSNIIWSEWLIRRIHKYAMERVSEYDYEGALADVCPAIVAAVERKWHKFCLQETFQASLRSCLNMSFCMSTRKVATSLPLIDVLSLCTSTENDMGSLCPIEITDSLVEWLNYISSKPSVTINASLPSAKLRPQTGCIYVSNRPP